MYELAAVINALVTTYKNIKELYEKADYIELKNHILAMNEQLIDMREAALELRSENIDLKEEVKKLNEYAEKEFVLKNGAYYDKNNVGPYCPTCYDNNKYLSLMCKPLPSCPPACPKCKYSMER